MLKKKLLLVIEEFNELVVLETIFKKVGFDVVGISNDISVHSQILSFNPDIIIISGREKRVNVLALGKKLKKQITTKASIVLLIRELNFLEQLDDMHIDAIIETPATPERFFEVLSHLSGADYKMLIDKYDKIRNQHQQKSMDVIFKTSVSSEKNAQDPLHISDPRRVAAYDKFLSDLPEPKQKSFDRGLGKKLIKQDEHGWAKERLQQLDQLKQKFVQILFKK